MSTFIKLITNDKFKGIVAIAAAVLMYFTPDEIDKIIEGLLGVHSLTWQQDVTCFFLSFFMAVFISVFLRV